MAYVSPTAHDISDLVDYMLMATGLPDLDGGKVENRGWARSAVRKFNGVDAVKLLIVAAMKDDFHRKNLTSFRYLLNHGYRIMLSTQGMRPRGSVIE